MRKKLVLSAILAVVLVEASELDLGMGAGVMYYPDYLGSDQDNTLFIPYPYISYTSKNLQIDKDGIQQQLFSIDGLSMRLSMSGSLPVKSSGAREGMNDLDPAGEIGPALVYKLYEEGTFSLKLDFPIRAVISTDWEGIDYRGYIYDPKISINYDFYDGYEFQLHTGGAFADSRYHNYLYGVKDSFVTDDRVAYHAKGGYSGYKTSMGISKRFENIWAGAFLRYYSLTGSSFADSPLKLKNSAIYSGIFVAYLFDKEFSRKVKRWLE
jgi:outer membrane scaffolding protein for murein synthesis (MipA/OmpV family)